MCTSGAASGFNIDETPFGSSVRQPEGGGGDVVDIAVLYLLDYRQTPTNRQQ
jgi:hypothetical protein